MILKIRRNIQYNRKYNVITENILVQFPTYCHRNVWMNIWGKPPPRFRQLTRLPLPPLRVNFLPSNPRTRVIFKSKNYRFTQRRKVAEDFGPRFVPSFKASCGNSYRKGMDRILPGKILRKSIPN